LPAFAAESAAVAPDSGQVANLAEKDAGKENPKQDNPQDAEVVQQDQAQRAAERPAENQPLANEPIATEPKAETTPIEQPSLWDRVRSVVIVLLTALFGAFIAVVVLHTRRSRTLSVSVAEGQLSVSEQPVTGWQEVAGQFADVFLGKSAGSAPRIAVERLLIRNFKNIEDLELDLSLPSELDANWTCIAGINGAGKSSILQVISLLLLGERRVAELGVARLQRMLRRTDHGSLDCELSATVRVGEEENLELFIPLGKDGPDENKLRSHPDYGKMRAFWEFMDNVMFLSYGATRNLSEHKDTRYEGLRPMVQRQMTLFDPLTRVSGVDVLLESDDKDKKKIKTLYRVLKEVVGDEELAVDFSRGGDRLVFEQAGINVDAVDLPDGFRSTVAWLADLCTAWHDTAPEGVQRSTDPVDMTGIVLLDEIALHLHPSLSRSIVPQLRKALPGVQFVVTTHSPLILSSFDRSELIMLETDEEGRVEERKLDRQVFGFSTDEVYSWLMRTKPHSTVMERKALEADDPRFAEYLYQSEDIDEDDAKILADDIKSLLNELKDGSNN